MSTTSSMSRLRSMKLLGMSSHSGIYLATDLTPRYVQWHTPSACLDPSSKGSTRNAPPFCPTPGSILRCHPHTPNSEIDTIAAYAKERIIGAASGLVRYHLREFPTVRLDGRAPAGGVLGISDSTAAPIVGKQEPQRHPSEQHSHQRQCLLRYS